MAATREDVNQWIITAKKRDCKYIMSICDTFDHGDYPIYCKTVKEVKENYPVYNNKMQRINEVIRINDDGTVDENLNLSLI
jgi:hypothetical protein